MSIDIPPRVLVTYIIGQIDMEGPVKIGRSKHAAARLLSIQTGYPYDLRIEHWWGGDIEKPMHEALTDYRLRGEWYRRECVHEALALFPDKLQAWRAPIAAPTVSMPAWLPPERAVQRFATGFKPDRSRVITVNGKRV
jgi:hypothetical protein